jgi:hypothetical protein
MLLIVSSVIYLMSLIITNDEIDSKTTVPAVNMIISHIVLYCIVLYCIFICSRNPYLAIQPPDIEQVMSLQYTT